MFKKQSGITLVALVITIIVLLILAGVSLSLLTGSDSIVNKARNAGTTYNAAAVNEATTVNGLINQLNNI